MNEKSSWVVDVKEENDDWYINIPTDLLAQMGWTEGTELFWVIDDDQIFLTDKKNDISEK